ncbi:MAG: DUF6789 family protein [Trueperaceae bacterium]
MHVLAAMLAGVVGTAVMTVLMGAGPAMGLAKMDMPRLLGTMLITNDPAARRIGTVVHFAMGALLGAGYLLLWSWGLASAGWIGGSIIGFVHGLVAAATMPLMLRMHPRPPKLTLNAAAFVGIVLGHVVFGFVLGLTYLVVT